MRVLRIDESNWDRFGEQVRGLEAGATYPLGADRFRIDHGPDYFAFFRRLGELHLYAAIERGEVLAVGAGVLRRVPMRAWYLCDLKVRPDARGRHLPLTMVSRLFLPKYLRCARGYAISMNVGDAPNRMARLVSHFRWARTDVAVRLLLWSLDHAAMSEVEPLVRRHRGALGYLSLRGKKDIVLESTQQPLPLLHVQFGPAAEAAESSPRSGHVHMFCAPEGDALSSAMRGAGQAPSATATVIHHRMKGCDWRFVLTSEI